MSKTGKFTAILLLLALLGGPGQCLAAAPQSETLGAKTPQSITVVSDDDYPPYIFRNSEKELQGILVDMWKAWEKQTQIKVNLLAMSWVKAQAFFQEGKADVIDTMFINEERLKTYEFGRPYATIDVSVFYHKSLGGLSNLDSLQGFAVGVKSGDSSIKLLKNSNITTLKEYDSYQDIIEAAANQKIKVFTVDKPPAMYYLYKYALEDEFRYSFNLYSGEFHRAVMKGNGALLELVEKGFEQIPKQEYDRIDRKWMGTRLIGPEYREYIVLLIYLVVAVSLILGVFALVLRKRVKSKTLELSGLLGEYMRSEEKFRSLVNNINVGIFRATGGVDSVFLQVNPAMAGLFGFDSAKQMLKTKCSQLYVDLEDKAALYEEIMRESRVTGLELYMQRRDRTRLRVMVNIQGVFDAEGNLSWVDGVIEDVTERLAMQERIKNSERRLQDIMNMSSSVFYVKDLDGKYQLINSTFADIFHLDDTSVLGQDDYSIHPPDIAETLRRNDKLVLEKGEPIEFEESLLLDKGLRTYSSQKFPLRDINSKIYALCGISTDISERKQAEEELRQSRDRFEKIFRFCPIAVSLTDHEARYLTVNEQFTRVSGYSPEELIGVSALDLGVWMYPDEREMMTDLIERYGGAHEREVSFRHKSGAAIICLTSMIPVVMEGENCFLTLAIDITQRKQHEEAMNHSLEEKVVLLREVHHRVKNNLQIISSLLNLQANYVTDSATMDILNKTKNRIMSMAIVHELLYSEPDLSSIRIDTYIKSLANQVTQSFYDAARRIRLSFELPDIDLEINQAIPCGLIVNELLTNVYKHAFAGLEHGEINIRAERDAERFSIIISDNGVGMDENRTLSQERLGMQLVSALVGQLKGELRLSSAQGTKVSVSFPYNTAWARRQLRGPDPGTQFAI